MSVPARLVLRQAEATNTALGHVNLGALSESHGFLSVFEPIPELPPPYDVWTDAARSLPDLCDSMDVRRCLDKLPTLDASPGLLADKHLLRASSVISILAQAYYNVEMSPVRSVPDALAKPWTTIAWRLNKPRWTFSTTDYIFHNWKLIDPSNPDPMRVENLKLITPVWNNPGVELFMLVVLEMLAQSTPMLGAVLRAQEAVFNRDTFALKTELTLITKVLKRITFDSLLKASPNRYSGSYYVDPVVWTKTFAMLPLPIKPNVHNATGVETPFFHMLDEFFERRDYKTQLGGEALTLRNAFPSHWKQFMTALRQVSVSKYVDASGSRELRGLFEETRQAYMGCNGLLARHRLKAFTFMDAAFKTGRTSTVTGFSGLFKDRAWDLVDTSFENSRIERDQQYPSHTTFSHIKEVTDAGCKSQTIRRVIFDVKGLGIRYQPGDRLAVLPENSVEMVTRTLMSLDADGSEEIMLTQAWRRAVGNREGFEQIQTLPLSELLGLGHVRPVRRDVVKRLHALTKNEYLQDLLDDRMEDQCELWDVIERLKTSGFNPERLLSALPGESHHICWIVPPMLPRQYSICSAPASVDVPAEEIELTVGQLSYESVASRSTRCERRQGTGSSFLCRDIQPAARAVSISLIHPPRFSLPIDLSTPIVMFAAGTGVAPFRSFLQARMREESGRNVLFLGVRDGRSILYRNELEALQATGRLELHLALSREAVRPVFDYNSGTLQMEPGEACRIDQLILEPEIADQLKCLIRPKEEGGEGATVYVCGRANVAKSVMEALVHVLGRGGTAEEAREDGYSAIYRMVGSGRYMQDVYTTYTGVTASRSRQIDVSQLIRYNTPENGLWQTISGRVYDLTMFAHLHPGGAKLIQSYAGMDATHAYRKVEHHLNSEVDSMLAMFEIGIMRRLDFGMEWAATVGDDGLEFMLLSTLFRNWVRFTYLYIEIENAYHVETTIKNELLIKKTDGQNLLNSAYKFQFQILAHHRFLNLSLVYLAEEIGKLWKRTASICDASADIQWMDRTLTALRDDPVTQTTVAWTEELQNINSGLTGECLERWHKHILKLQAADVALMKGIKDTFSTGLQVFETHERNTIRLGAADLLKTLRRLPLLVRDYYRQLAQEQACHK